jgi:hypothetical protein
MGVEVSGSNITQIVKYDKDKDDNFELFPLVPTIFLV